MLFGLAVVSREDVYWEVKEAIMMCKDRIKEVHPGWIKERES